MFSQFIDTDVSPRVLEERPREPDQARIDRTRTLQTRQQFVLRGDLGRRRAIFVEIPGFQNELPNDGDILRLIAQFLVRYVVYPTAPHP